MLCHPKASTPPVVHYVDCGVLAARRLADLAPTLVSRRIVHTHSSTVRLYSVRLAIPRSQPLGGVQVARPARGAADCFPRGRLHHCVVV